MKRLMVLIAAVLSFSIFLLAWQPVAAKDTWISVRSKHFLLIGNANEKEIRQVATRLEQFREVFSHMFTKINFNSPVATTVIVFKSESSYRPFKPNANTAGYFQPGPDVNYITLNIEAREEQDPFNIIFHEYTHLLVNNTVGNVPTWFNEGLAEYYSTFSIAEDQKVVLGKPIGNHVYLLRENKMLPLRTLFQVDTHSPYYNERDKQSVFYAESWALMHYLILGKNGERLPQIDKFLRLMDSNVPMEQAFQQSFQMTFESLEKELREYIKRDSYPVARGHFENKLEFHKEMQTAPLTEAEAQAYLGDLLLHSNRAESEGYLQKALALDPNLPMANASMAMVEVRKGKIDEALKNLEVAAAKSQNYLIHYYYAYALSRQGMNAAEMVAGYTPETAARMREELKKAIALRPDFPESYHLLVFVNLVTGTQLDESIDLLKRVLVTSPGRSDLLFLLAQVYLRKEDYQASRQLLERLSQNNADSSIREQAQSLLTQVAAQQEQLKRFEAMQKAASEGAPRPTLVRRTGGDVSAVESPADPFETLRESLRQAKAGETRVQGLLLRIDCDAKGITFSIKTDDRVLRLHVDKFDNMNIVAFTNAAGSEITCGARKVPDSVVVCYVPARSDKSKLDGEATSLEFVPKEFKLKS